MITGLLAMVVFFIMIIFILAEALLDLHLLQEINQSRGDCPLVRRFKQ